MTNIFTIIHYKAGEDGWRDRCDNYHDGEASEHELFYFTNAQLASEKLGELQFKYPSEPPTLLINGIDINKTSEIFFDSNDNYLSGFSHEYEKKLEQVYDEIDNLAFNHRVQLEENHKKLKIEAENRKKEEELKIKQQLQLKKELEEKKQLASLIAKYGKDFI